MSKFYGEITVRMIIKANNKNGINGNAGVTSSLFVLNSFPIGDVKSEKPSSFSTDIACFSRSFL